MGKESQSSQPDDENMCSSIAFNLGSKLGFSKKAYNGEMRYRAIIIMLSGVALVMVVMADIGRAWNRLAQSLAAGGGTFRQCAFNSAASQTRRRMTLLFPVSLRCISNGHLQKL
jgi:hypothetical protein